MGAWNDPYTNGSSSGVANATGTTNSSSGMMDEETVPPAVNVCVTSVGAICMFMGVLFGVLGVVLFRRRHLSPIRGRQPIVLLLISNVAWMCMAMSGGAQ